MVDTESPDAAPTQREPLPDPLAETVASSDESSGIGPPPSVPDIDVERAVVKEKLFGIEIDQRIGRFRVIKKLGQGGMGVVYAAHDEELDRRVAIKLLRSNFPGGAKRLHREARAMARLAHPNVVTVHDVGNFEDGIYVAMEFVEGPSLRAWLAQDHDWRERLGILHQAGQGLAAAHRMGMVHRDFKPENVIVGRDRRVRVLDFGLAKAAAEDVESSAMMQLELKPLSDLTQTGVIIGTPVYMSPEQLRLEITDARSDQFSFCVVAYETLYGVRPFDGSTLAEIGVAVASGEIRPPPDDAGIPPVVRDAILRGLSVDKDERFPRMRDLLAVLEDPPQEDASQKPMTRRRLAFVGVAAILAAVGWFAEFRCGADS